jgi:hypothetical protein
MKNVPLSAVLGEHWEMPLAFNKADGTNLDVTGATVVWLLASVTSIIMTREWSPTITNQGIVMSDAVNGNGSLVVTPEMQREIDPEPVRGIYRHEVFVVLPDDTVSVQAGGTFELDTSLKWKFGL